MISNASKVCFKHVDSNKSHSPGIVTGLYVYIVLFDIVALIDSGASENCVTTLWISEKSNGKKYHG